MVKKPKSEPKKADHNADELKKQNAELSDSLKRLAADFDNFRRLKTEEHKKANHLATNDLVMQIFPILDNFRRASEHTPKIDVTDEHVPELTEDELRRINAYFEGVRQIEKQLEEVLKSAGLVRIETQGREFDHNTMEAIAYEAHPELPEGTIIDEVEGGYKLADKVVRCAKVRVSKGQ